MGIITTIRIWLLLPCQILATQKVEYYLGDAKCDPNFGGLSSLEEGTKVIRQVGFAIQCCIADFCIAKTISRLDFLKRLD